MGTANKVGMEAEAVLEEEWAKQCTEEGWQCSRCDAIPPYGEKDIFEETGMCGYCAHMTSKDD